MVSVIKFAPKVAHAVRQEQYNSRDQLFKWFSSNQNKIVYWEYDKKLINLYNPSI